MENDMGLKARPKKTTAIKLPTDVQKSLEIYVEAIHDVVKRHKDKPAKHRMSELFTDLDDYPDLDEHAGLQWLLGYVAACAEIIEVQPETLL
jgi:hypothetical protein